MLTRLQQNADNALNDLNAEAQASMPFSDPRLL
jgi:hypothetical protein